MHLLSERYPHEFNNIKADLTMPSNSATSRKVSFSPETIVCSHNNVRELVLIEREPLRKVHSLALTSNSTLSHTGE